MKLKIHVNIKDREKIYFDGEVNAVTTYNEFGIFDILPLHENFISLVKNKVILHDDINQRVIKFDSGLLKANADKVNIYLGI
jgi:F0F1-type ATP synthase epsilon subunit